MCMLDEDYTIILCSPLFQYKDLPKSTQGQNPHLQIPILQAFSLWKDIVYKTKRYINVSVYLLKETKMLPVTWKNLFTLQAYMVHLSEANTISARILFC